MAEKKKNRAKIVRAFIKTVPYFKIENLLAIEDDEKYLRILLSRWSKTGVIIRLKRGLYVHRDYFIDVQIKNKTNSYYEFLACSMFDGAYLGLEYVLSEYGLLSETVYGYSLVSTKKPIKFKNEFGFFNSHSIKVGLFTGYQLIKKDGYYIKKASLAKALFDFLYFRKNILSDSDNVAELRLNLEILQKKDIIELKKYIKLEASKKMLEIYNYLNI